MSACRDPDDNKFLEAAVAVGAEYVVTSDKDLRDLGEYEGMKIEDPLVMRRSTVRIRSPAPRPLFFKHARGIWSCVPLPLSTFGARSHRAACVTSSVRFFVQFPVVTLSSPQK